MSFFSSEGAGFLEYTLVKHVVPSINLEKRSCTPPCNILQQLILLVELYSSQVPLAEQNI
jgi:hypothetical protein